MPARHRVGGALHGEGRGDGVVARTHTTLLHLLLVSALHSDGGGVGGQVDGVLARARGAGLL